MLPLILALTSRTAHARDSRTADASLLGPAQAPFTGWSLADVGDVDGDSQADVLIGSPDRGRVDGSDVPSSRVRSPTGWTVRCGDAVVTAAHDGAGMSVAGAGDVDADGYDDVIIGAPGYGQPGRPNLGAAYLVLGPVTGSFDLSLADATFVGPKTNAYLGGFESVSSAGDVDGDGQPDLLMGASGINPKGWASCCTGGAFVMSGTRRGSHGYGPRTPPSPTRPSVPSITRHQRQWTRRRRRGWPRRLPGRVVRLLRERLRLLLRGRFVRLVRSGRRPAGPVRCRREARWRGELRIRGHLGQCGGRRRRRGRSPRHLARRGSQRRRWRPGRRGLPRVRWRDGHALVERRGRQARRRGRVRRSGLVRVRRRGRGCGRRRRPPRRGVAERRGRAGRWRRVPRRGPVTASLDSGRADRKLVGAEGEAAGISARAPATSTGTAARTCSSGRGGTRRTAARPARPTCCTAVDSEPAEAACSRLPWSSCWRRALRAPTASSPACGRPWRCPPPSADRSSPSSHPMTARRSGSRSAARGLTWRPRSGGPAGPGPTTYRVVLTDEEWDEVVALSGPTLTGS